MQALFTKVALKKYSPVSPVFCPSGLYFPSPFFPLHTSGIP